MNRVGHKIERSEEPPALSGKRILITRARAQARALADRIEDLGGEVIEFPTIEIRPPESYNALDEAITKIGSYDWAIFTSVNGVEVFLQRLRHLKKGAGMLERISIAAIGPETAKRLEEAGLRPEVVPRQYRAEGILDALKAEDLRGKRVLLPRAAGGRKILPETLRQWGAEVDVVDTYYAVLPSTDPSPVRHLLQEGRIDAVTFTSSSTVSHFVRLFPGEEVGRLLERTAVACIGPITQVTAEESGIRVDVVSDEYTIPGLVDAIAGFFKRREQSHEVTPRGQS